MIYRKLAQHIEITLMTMRREDVADLITYSCFILYLLTYMLNVCHCPLISCCHLPLKIHCGSQGIYGNRYVTCVEPCPVVYTTLTQYMPVIKGQTADTVLFF